MNLQESTPTSAIQPISRLIRGTGIIQLFASCGVDTKFILQPKESLPREKITMNVLRGLASSLSSASDTTLENILEFLQWLDCPSRLVLGGSNKSINIGDDLMPYYRRDAMFVKEAMAGHVQHNTSHQWDEVASGISQQVGELLNRSIKVIRLPISSPDHEFPVSHPLKMTGKGKKRALENDPSKHVAEPPICDLDERMAKEGADIAIVHNNVQILFAAPSESLSLELTNMADTEAGVKPPNELVIDGIESVTSRDDNNKTAPKEESALHVANSGAAARLNHAPNSEDKAMQAVVGSRNAKVRLKDEAEPIASFDSSFAPMYHNNLLPVFKQLWVKEHDDLYGQRHDKGGRVPRVSAQTALSQRVSREWNWPYLRLESTPLFKPASVKYLKGMVYAVYESWVRQSSEILLEMLASIPGTMMGIIGHNNTVAAFNKLNNRHPQRNVSRVLPKASMGTKLCKPLHDDENGIYSLGVWRCLQDDGVNDVMLRFVTTEMQWQIKSTSGRMCLFNGMVPHKTLTAKGITFASKKKRIHHTAYIKPVQEFASLVLFSEQFINSIEITE